MKKIFLVSILLFSYFAQSQTYIKGNALTALALIPHFGVETSIGKKSTLQFDALASFWKSIKGRPFEFSTFTAEYRYHFKEKFNGFYAGGHVGWAVYKIQKWDHLANGDYQQGIGYYIGATIGYQKKLGDRFVLDFFLGGGSFQGYYKGYSIETGERLDLAIGYNKSGEWIPTRGGIMICYKL